MALGRSPDLFFHLLLEAYARANFRGGTFLSVLGLVGPLTSMRLFQPRRRFMDTEKENKKSSSSKTEGQTGPTKGLDALFLNALKDIYYAENKILKALPKLAKGAESEELTAAFEKHLGETQGQVARLEQVFELLGLPAKGKTCPAIDGIVEEGDEILEEYIGAPALDAGLVAAAQAVEHYEIARYGALVAWADLLGLTDAANLLNATLDEELATEQALTQLSEGGINERALEEAA
jgi:ferritin-like metal-binding protein YciE